MWIHHPNGIQFLVIVGVRKVNHIADLIFVGRQPASVLLQFCQCHRRSQGQRIHREQRAQILREDIVLQFRHRGRNRLSGCSQPSGQCVEIFCVIVLLQPGIQFHAAGGGDTSRQPHFARCIQRQPRIGPGGDGHGRAALHLEGHPGQHSTSGFDAQIGPSADHHLTVVTGDSQHAAFPLQECGASRHHQLGTHSGRFHGGRMQNAARTCDIDPTAVVLRHDP